MTPLNKYTDYFRQLAVRHYLIRHNPNAETGNAMPQECRFARWNQNEAIGGLRATIGYPALLLELYETNGDGDYVGDVKLRPKGAITIIDHAKEGDYADEQRAESLCEEIMIDILKQIYQDHYGSNKDRCETPFRQVRFNDIEIIPTGKIFTNEFGWRAEFPFEFQNDIRLNEPPADGTFLDPQ